MNEEDKKMLAVLNEIITYCEERGKEYCSGCVFRSKSPWHDSQNWCTMGALISAKINMRKIFE